MHVLLQHDLLLMWAWRSLSPFFSDHGCCESFGFTHSNCVNLHVNQAGSLSWLTRLDQFRSLFRSILIDYKTLELNYFGYDTCCFLAPVACMSHPRSRTIYLIINMCHNNNNNYNTNIYTGCTLQLKDVINVRCKGT